MIFVYPDPFHETGPDPNGSGSNTLDVYAVCLVHQEVGVLVDKQRNLHIYINGVDQGVAAKHIPDKVRRFTTYY